MSSREAGFSSISWIWISSSLIFKKYTYFMKKKFLFRSSFSLSFFFYWLSLLWGRRKFGFFPFFIENSKSCIIISAKFDSRFEKVFLSGSVSLKTTYFLVGKQPVVVVIFFVKTKDSFIKVYLLTCLFLIRNHVKRS